MSYLRCFFGCCLTITTRYWCGLQAGGCALPFYMLPVAVCILQHNAVMSCSVMFRESVRIRVYVVVSLTCSVLYLSQ